jgi:hypothetical protein
MRRSLQIRVFSILTILTLSAVIHGIDIPTASSASGPAWHVLDQITPTIGSVEWVEKANYTKPVSWIADGRWYEAHRRQVLVKPNDIFASFSEAMNWTAVNNSFHSPYSSFDDFKDSITSDPAWWLEYSWSIDVKAYGVPLNKTVVRTVYNETSSRAEIYMWCHITNIPEYILGEKQLETLLTGFDLTSISIGSLEAFQWYQDSTASLRSYYVYFKTSANIITQNKDGYSLTLDVSPLYHNESYNVEQEIRILMPPETDVTTASPSSKAAWSGNIATFTIHRGDLYPASYSVTSGPRVKNLGERFTESVNRWLTEPAYWVALGSASAILYSAYLGNNLRRRRKTYYRLYRSMVSIFDRSSSDPQQLHQEINTLSSSIHKYFIEDKITDEQFEKLMAQRDHLIERTGKNPPINP